MGLLSSHGCGVFLGTQKVKKKQTELPEKFGRAALRPCLTWQRSKLIALDIEPDTQEKELPWTAQAVSCTPPPRSLAGAQLWKAIRLPGLKEAAKERKRARDGHVAHEALSGS